MSTYHVDEILKVHRNELVLSVEATDASFDLESITNDPNLEWRARQSDDYKNQGLSSR